MVLNHSCRATPYTLVSFAAAWARVTPRACVTPEGDNRHFEEKVTRERLRLYYSHCKFRRNTKQHPVQPAAYLAPSTPATNNFNFSCTLMYHILSQKNFRYFYSIWGSKEQSIIRKVMRRVSVSEKAFFCCCCCFFLHHLVT